MDCEVCGKEISRKAKRFCSHACRLKAIKGNGGFYFDRRKKPRNDCLVCGKPVKRFGLHYCSTSCYHQSRIGKIELNKRRREIKICVNCGKEFEAGGRSGHRLTTKYCSHKCQGLASRKSTGTGAWKRLSEIVIERDKKCQLCGATKEEKGLQAHHIDGNGFGRPWNYDGNCSPDKLIALCTICHSIVERMIKLGRQNNSSFSAREFIELIRIR
jgi:hypothetical protein